MKLIDTLPVLRPAIYQCWAQIGYDAVEFIVAGGVRVVPQEGFVTIACAARAMRYWWAQ